MKETNVHSDFSNLSRYLLLAIVIVALATSPALATQLTSGVSFAQVSFTAANPPQKYSQFGQVTVDYAMTYGAGYVNVERYENGRPAGWIVQNLPVVDSAALSSFSTLFDLGTSGYVSNIDVYVDFSPVTLANDSVLKNQTPLTYRVGQAELALLPPADKTEPYRVVLYGSCLPTDHVMDFENMNAQDFETQAHTTIYCIKNSTKVNWGSLTVADTNAPDRALEARQEYQFFDKFKVAKDSVVFSGTKNTAGIPIGREARLILLSNGTGGTGKVTPGN